jgi:hypothetical protein
MNEQEILSFKNIQYRSDFTDLSVKRPIEQLNLVRNDILSGSIVIFKTVYQPELIKQIIAYLCSVGRSSLPNYVPISRGCPNSHRVNQNDQRSYVKACYHQFQFLPWNQDIFNFFSLFRPVFHLKNLLNNLDAEEYLSTDSIYECTTRLAFQFYPAGAGCMNKHTDPLDFHQMVIPTLVMSTAGKDFDSGGFYVENQDGERLYLDSVCTPGDIIFFNPRIMHGVDTIDREQDTNWLEFRGRWMGLFATNKLAGVSTLANSIDLGES